MHLAYLNPGEPDKFVRIEIVTDKKQRGVTAYCRVGPEDFGEFYQGRKVASLEEISVVHHKRIAMKPFRRHPALINVHSRSYKEIWFFNPDLRNLKPIERDQLLFLAITYPELIPGTPEEGYKYYTYDIPSYSWKNKLGFESIVLKVQQKTHELEEIIPKKTTQPQGENLSCSVLPLIALKVFPFAWQGCLIIAALILIYLAVKPKINLPPPSSGLSEDDLLSKDCTITSYENIFTDCPRVEFYKDKMETFIYRGAGRDIEEVQRILEIFPAIKDVWLIDLGYAGLWLEDIDKRLVYSQEISRENGGVIDYYNFAYLDSQLQKYFRVLEKIKPDGKTSGNYLALVEWQGRILQIHFIKADARQLKTELGIAPGVTVSCLKFPGDKGVLDVDVDFIKAVSGDINEGGLIYTDWSRLNIAALKHNKLEIVSITDSMKAFQERLFTCILEKAKSGGSFRRIFGLLRQRSNSRTSPTSPWLKGTMAATALLVLFAFALLANSQAHLVGFPAAVAMAVVIGEGGKDDDSGKGKDWPELAYHQHILETGNLQAKLVALEAIVKGLSTHPSVPRDQILNVILQQYQAADERLRASCMRVMARLGLQIPVIREIVLRTLHSEATPVSILSHCLEGARLSGYVDKEILEATRVLLFRLNEDIVFAALQFFLITSDSLWRNRIPVSPDALRQDVQLVNQLKKLQQSTNNNIRNSARHLLIRMGLIREQTSWEEREEFVEFLETQRKQGRQRCPQLNMQEMARLYARIQKQGMLPSRFLAERFREGRKAIFLAHDTDARSLSKLADDILQLREDVSLTHLALPFPVSETENFKKFVKGEISAGSWKYDKLGIEIDPQDPADIENVMLLQQVLQRLDGKIRFVLYGSVDEVFSPEAPKGELLLNRHVKAIEQVIEEIPNARILVIGGLLEISKENPVTDDEIPTDLSVAYELAERIGEEQVCSIVETDAERWEQDSNDGTHNLSDFLDRFPLPTSFGINIQGTPLAKLRYWIDYKNTFGSGWDGLIFRKYGGDDNAFFEEPQLPRETIKTPAPEPSGELVVVGPKLSKSYTFSLFGLNLGIGNGLALNSHLGAAVFPILVLALFGFVLWFFNLRQVRNFISRAPPIIAKDNPPHNSPERPENQKALKGLTLNHILSLSMANLSAGVLILVAVFFMDCTIPAVKFFFKFDFAKAPPGFSFNDYLGHFNSHLIFLIIALEITGLVFLLVWANIRLLLRKGSLKSRFYLGGNGLFIPFKKARHRAIEIPDPKKSASFVVSSITSNRFHLNKGLISHLYGFNQLLIYLHERVRLFFSADDREDCFRNKTAIFFASFILSGLMVTGFYLPVVFFHSHLVQAAVLAALITVMYLGTSRMTLYRFHFNQKNLKKILRQVRQFNEQRQYDEGVTFLNHRVERLRRYLLFKNRTSPFSSALVLKGFSVKIDYQHYISTQPFFGAVEKYLNTAFFRGRIKDCAVLVVYRDLFYVASVYLGRKYSLDILHDDGIRRSYLRSIYVVSLEHASLYESVSRGDSSWRGAFKNLMKRGREMWFESRAVRGHNFLLRAILIYLASGFPLVVVQHFIRIRLHLRKLRKQKEDISEIFFSLISNAVDLNPFLSRDFQECVSRRSLEPPLFYGLLAYLFVTAHYFSFSVPLLPQVQQDAVNIGILGIGDDQLALAREGSKRQGANFIVVDSEFLTFAKLGKRQAAQVQCGLIFKDGHFQFVILKEPCTLHYVLGHDSKNKKLRENGIPLAGHPLIDEYTDEKTVAWDILASAGVRVPRSMVILTKPYSYRGFKARWKKYPRIILGGYSDNAVEVDSGGRRGGILIKIQDRKRLADFLSSLIGWFMVSNEIEEVVIKPDGGSGGRGVHFFSEHTFRGELAYFFRGLLGGHNFIMQERLTPPLLSPSRDWNLRVFVSKNEQGGIQVDDMVVRTSDLGKVVNISRGADVMTVEQLHADLLMTDKISLWGWKEFLDEVKKTAVDSYVAIENAMRADGVLKNGEDPTDFMGVDVIVQQEGGRLVPYVMEVNGYESGGMWDLDSIASAGQIGRSSQGFVAAMILRAEKYRRGILCGLVPLVVPAVGAAALAAIGLALSQIFSGQAHLAGIPLLAAMGAIGSGKGNLREDDLRKEKLAKVWELVKAKQEEFNKIADTHLEEGLDRERALKRIAQVGEIAEVLLLLYPEGFDSYVSEAAKPLLNFDARMLNLLLASSLVGRLRKLKQHLDKAHSEKLSEFYVAAIFLNWFKLILKSRKEWRKANNFFYLSGLPIVIEAEAPKLQRIRNLKKATQLIKSSGWYILMPDSLKHISSIIPKERVFANSDEVYSSTGLGDFEERLHIEIYFDIMPLEISATLIHEDQHISDELNRLVPIINFESKEHLPADIKHEWCEPDGTWPSFLLAEVQAYGTESLFFLHIWKLKRLSPMQRRAIIENLFNHLPQAKKGIEILKEKDKIGHLNSEGRVWLQELEVLWKGIENELGLLWNIEVAKILLTSIYRNCRLAGYVNTLHRLLSIIDLFLANPEQRQEQDTYRKILKRAIRKENDLYILRTLVKLFSTSQVIDSSLRNEIIQALQRAQGLQSPTTKPKQPPVPNHKSRRPGPKKDTSHGFLFIPLGLGFSSFHSWQINSHFIWLGILAAVILGILGLWFNRQKGDGFSGVRKGYIEATKEIPTANEVKPYAQAGRKANGGWKGYIANLCRKFMPIDRNEASVAYHRKGLFAFFVIKFKPLGINYREKRDRSARINIGLGINAFVSAAKFKFNNGARKFFVNLVRKYYGLVHSLSKSMEEKSWGWGTGIPTGFPYFLIILCSILLISSPALIGKTLPLATKMYGYLPPYLSTISSKCSLIHWSLSIALVLAIFIILTSSRQKYTTSLSVSQDKLGSSSQPKTPACRQAGINTDKKHRLTQIIQPLWNILKEFWSTSSVAGWGPKFATAAVMLFAVALLANGQAHPAGFPALVAIGAVGLPFKRPIYGERDYWPGRMKIEDETLVDLEVLKVSNAGLLGNEKKTEWLLQNVFPHFSQASPETQRILQKQLSHPRRTHRQIEEARAPLQALMQAIGEETSAPSLKRLDEIIDLISEYSETKERFLLDLEDLRSYHYPYYSVYRKRPEHSPQKFREPYPEVTPALISLGRIILLLKEINEALPESDSPVIKKWKEKIQKTLNRPELKSFLRRRKFLGVLNSWWLTPYDFVKPEDLEEYRKGQGKYDLRFEESEERSSKRRISKAVMEEFSALAKELSDLWVINIESHQEGKAYPRNEGWRAEDNDLLQEYFDRSETDTFEDVYWRIKRSEAMARGMAHASRRHVECSSDKHPFLRQFPDGLMQSPLAKIEYYCRIAKFAIKNGYRFSDINQPTGTIKLSSYRNPVLIVRAGIDDDDIQPVAINLGGKNNCLLLSGPNMGGKTTTARGIGRAVLYNQIGLPIPDDAPQLGVFRNIYTVFPQPEQLQPGYGYFGMLIEKITELIKKAGPGDLIILDEVPTGTDYLELVAIATVLMEDLIKTGATVIVTGHLKKAFQLVQERTGQQPFMHTVKEEDGRVVPDFHLAPGIAKHSYAIELMSQVAFPDDIIELARAYYQFITQGETVTEVLVEKVARSSKEEEVNERSSAFEMFKKILWNLYPKENFALSRTQDRLLDIFTGTRQAIKASIKEIEGFLGEAKQGNETGDEIETRLRLLALFSVQGEAFLKGLQRRLSDFKEVRGKDFNWGRPKYEPKENTRKIQQMEKTIDALLKYIEILTSEKEIQEIKQAFEKIKELLNSLREKYTNEDIAGLEKKELEGLEAQWQKEYTSIFDKWLPLLLMLDEYNGVALSILRHGLKQPKLTNKPNVFSLKNSLPFFPNEFEWGSGDVEPFLRNGVRQSFAVNPEKPVFVLTGPNSSGKSVLMLNAFVNALFACYGFYVSGELEMSKFDSVDAFFGGRNVTETGESYFLNILKQYADMIGQVTPNSLLVLDELHGTDNFELAAIQLAVLHYLRKQNVTVIFNTHIRDGLKLAAERLGLDLWKTDVTYDAQTNRVKPHYTISPDPNLEAKSYGLAVASQWLSEDQMTRAQEILKQLADGSSPGTGTSHGLFLSSVGLGFGFANGWALNSHLGAAAFPILVLALLVVALWFFNLRQVRNFISRAPPLISRILNLRKSALHLRLSVFKKSLLIILTPILILSPIIFLHHKIPPAPALKAPATFVLKIPPLETSGLERSSQELLEEAMLKNIADEGSVREKRITSALTELITQVAQEQGLNVILVPNEVLTPDSIGPTRDFFKIQYKNLKKFLMAKFPPYSWEGIKAKTVFLEVHLDARWNNPYGADSQHPNGHYPQIYRRVGKHAYITIIYPNSNGQFKQEKERRNRQVSNWLNREFPATALLEMAIQNEFEELSSAQQVQYIRTEIVPILRHFLTMTDKSEIVPIPGHGGNTQSVFSFRGEKLGARTKVSPGRIAEARKKLAEIRKKAEFYRLLRQSPPTDKTRLPIEKDKFYPAPDKTKAGVRGLGCFVFPFIGLNISQAMGNLALPFNIHVESLLILVLTGALTTFIGQMLAQYFRTRKFDFKTTLQYGFFGLFIGAEVYFLNSKLINLIVPTNDALRTLLYMATGGIILIETSLFDYFVVHKQRFAGFNGRNGFYTFILRVYQFCKTFIKEKFTNHIVSFALVAPLALAKDYLCQKLDNQILYMAMGPVVMTIHLWIIKHEKPVLRPKIRKWLDDTNEFFKDLNWKTVVSLFTAVVLSFIGLERFISHSFPVFGQSIFKILAYQPSNHLNVQFFKIATFPCAISFIYLVVFFFTRGLASSWDGFKKWRMRLLFVGIIFIASFYVECMKILGDAIAAKPFAPSENPDTNIVLLLVSAVITFFAMKYFSFEPIVKSKAKNKQQSGEPRLQCALWLLALVLLAVFFSYIGFNLNDLFSWQAMFHSPPEALHLAAAQFLPNVYHSSAFNSPLMCLSALGMVTNLPSGDKNARAGARRTRDPLGHNLKKSVLYLAPFIALFLFFKLPYLYYAWMLYSIGRIVMNYCGFWPMVFAPRNWQSLTPRQRIEFLLKRIKTDFERKGEQQMAECISSIVDIELTDTFLPEPKRIAGNKFILNTNPKATRNWRSTYSTLLHELRHIWQLKFAQERIYGRLFTLIEFDAVAYEMRLATLSEVPILIMGAAVLSPLTCILYGVLFLIETLPNIARKARRHAGTFLGDISKLSADEELFNNCVIQLLPKYLRSEFISLPSPKDIKGRLIRLLAAQEILRSKEFIEAAQEIYVIKIGKHLYHAVSKGTPGAVPILEVEATDEDWVGVWEQAITTPDGRRLVVPEDVGLKIKAQRLKRKWWSRQDLAEKADVSITPIERVENGKKISSRSLMRIVQAFGMTVEELFKTETEALNELPSFEEFVSSFKEGHPSGWGFWQRIQALPDKQKIPVLRGFVDMLLQDNKGRKDSIWDLVLVDFKRPIFALGNRSLQGLFDSYRRNPLEYDIEILYRLQCELSTKEEQPPFPTLKDFWFDWLGRREKYGEQISWNYIPTEIIALWAKKNWEKTGRPIEEISGLPSAIVHQRGMKQFRQVLCIPASSYFVKKAWLGKYSDSQEVAGALSLQTDYEIATELLTLIVKGNRAAYPALKERLLPLFRKEVGSCLSNYNISRETGEEHIAAMCELAFERAMIYVTTQPFDKQEFGRFVNLLRGTKTRRGLIRNEVSNYVHRKLLRGRRETSLEAMTEEREKRGSRHDVAALEAYGLQLLEDRDTRQAVETVLNLLIRQGKVLPNQRDLFLTYLFDGFTSPEIADQYCVSPQVISRHIRNLRNKLREPLKKEDIDIDLLFKARGRIQRVSCPPFRTGKGQVSLFRKSGYTPMAQREEFKQRLRKNCLIQALIKETQLSFDELFGIFLREGLNLEDMEEEKMPLLIAQRILQSHPKLLDGASRIYLRKISNHLYHTVTEDKKQEGDILILEFEATEEDFVGAEVIASSFPGTKKILRKN